MKHPKILSMLVLAALCAAGASACNDRSDLTGAPVRAGVKETAPPTAFDLNQPFVLETSVGTVVAATATRRASSEGRTGDLVVDVITPTLEGAARRLILHDASTGDLPALSVWLEDLQGVRVWEMGWSAHLQETRIYEAGAGCRLDIAIVPLGDGQRETYNFTNAARTEMLSAVIGPAGVSDATLEQFRHRYALVKGVEGNQEGTLTTELITNPGFEQWLSERAPAGSVPDEDPSYINQEYERLCLALHECARIKCRSQPSNSLCIICTGGDVLCGLLDIFF